ILLRLGTVNCFVRGHITSVRMIVAMRSDLAYRGTGVGLALCDACACQTKPSRCATLVPDAPGKQVSQVGGRGDLTVDARSAIAPLLHPASGRGGQWRELRTLVNDIPWRLRSGACSARPLGALRTVANLGRTGSVSRAARWHMGASWRTGTLEPCSKP